MKILTFKIYDGLVKAVSFMNSVTNFTNNTVDFNIFFYVGFTQIQTKKDILTLNCPMCSNIYTDDVKLISEKNTEVMILLKLSTMCPSSLRL